MLGGAGLGGFNIRGRGVVKVQAETTRTDDFISSPTARPMLTPLHIRFIRLFGDNVSQARGNLRGIAKGTGRGRGVIRFPRILKPPTPLILNTAHCGIS